MITFALATSEFISRQKEMEQMHQKAFNGFPWFFHDSEEEVANEITDVTSKTGFQAFLAYDEKHQVVGTLTYDTPKKKQFIEERGKELGKFTIMLMKDNDVPSFVWEREIFVDPDFHKKGVATELRQIFIRHLKKKFPNGVIILTRMWDKNASIVHIAKKLGFHRTGIKSQSIKVNAECEYWYKIIKD